MIHIFKNLDAETATFEDFRIEFEKIFGYDFFEDSDAEDIPTGLIGKANHEFIRAYPSEGFVTLWIDDGTD